MLIGRDRRVARLVGGDRLAPTPQLVTGAAALAGLEGAGLSSVLLRSGGSAALSELAGAGLSRVALRAAAAAPVQLQELLGSGHSALALLGGGAGELASLAGSGTASVISAVTAWLRLAASTPDTGKWASVADVLNPSAPAVQTVEGRRPAVGSSANGLPVMVFGGDDVLAWPTTAAISNTTTQGYWFWIRYAGSGIQQRILEMRAVVGGGTPHRLSITISTTGALLCDVYITNSNGRRFTTSLTLTVGQWYAIYWQYDSSRGGDANLALYVDGVSVSLTPSDIGAGGALGALRAFAGDALIGAGQNQDSPSGALANGSEVGPNLYAFNANLTAAQIQAFLQFERPTV